LHVKQTGEIGFGNPITHWFQPIYHLKDNSIIGYEALLRDASQAHLPPIKLFENAEMSGCRNILDMVSIKTAIHISQDQVQTLFLNIFPSTLLSQNFLFWWDDHVPADIPIVLELLENEPVANWIALKGITKELRERGVKIAVDDMGGGYSFFQQWVELDPEYIKLDRYFSDNLAADIRKQRAVRSITDLTANSTKIILEGVETIQDLKAAEFLGISYAQGYLLGRPVPLESFPLANTL